MALFARRVIQRMVDHLAQRLQPSDLRKIVDAINRADDNSLSFQWELAVLYGLSQLGFIKYEANFGGDTFPDVHFQDESGTSEFIADITCVSDVGVITKSMIEVFEEEFVSYVEAVDLNANNFCIKIGAQRTGNYPNEEMSLLLPNRARMKRVMDKKFVPFLTAIEERCPSQLSIDEDDFHVVVSYEPDRYTLGCHHPLFTVGYAETNNALYNALQKKRVQLKKSNYEGPKGVIVCDGGSDLLRTEYASRNSFSTEDIVRKFVRDNSGLDFVMILHLEEGRVDGTNKLNAKGFLMRDHTRENTTLSSALDAILPLPQRIPKSDRSVRSARNFLQASGGRVGASHFGAYVMGDRQIKISCRFLLELLAAKGEADRYFLCPSLSASSGDVEGENPFKKWLAEGRTIVSSSVERSDNEDDDWITLKFGDPDPAISPIRVPSRKLK